MAYIYTYTYIYVCVSFPGASGKEPVCQCRRCKSLGQEDPLEERMAIHSSILAWRILWTGEPGGLQSKGLHRVRHDWSNLASMRAHTHTHNGILLSHNKEWNNAIYKNRGWDGWIASQTQGTWVWASSGRWWRTGKPGVLQSIGLQKVRHDWATELNRIKLTKTRMDLKIIILSEVTQRKTNTICYHLYVESKIWHK